MAAQGLVIGPNVGHNAGKVDIAPPQQDSAWQSTAYSAGERVEMNQVDNETHRLKGTRPTRAAAKESVAHSGAPSMPKDLTKNQIAAWREVIKFLKPRCTLTKADGIALRLYAQEWARHKALLLELETFGELVDVTICDSSGTAHTKRVLNPAGKMASQCANFLKAMLREFSLTPASRETVTRPKPAPPKANALVPGTVAWYMAQESEQAEPAPVLEPESPPESAPAVESETPAEVVQETAGQPAKDFLD